MSAGWQIPAILEGDGKTQVISNWADHLPQSPQCVRMQSSCFGGQSRSTGSSSLLSSNKTLHNCEKAAMPHGTGMTALPFSAMIEEGQI